MCVWRGRTSVQADVNAESFYSPLLCVQHAGTTQLYLTYTAQEAEGKKHM